jgi:hypothetical protein
MLDNKAKKVLKGRKLQINKEFRMKKLYILLIKLVNKMVMKMNKK